MLVSGTSLRGGRYELVAFLRAGGAGVVWSAIDLKPPSPGSWLLAHSRECAIKILDAQHGGRDTAALEAEVARRVEHPGIVRVRDSFDEGGLSFIVMDRALGSLADLVDRSGPLTPPEALGALLPVVEALNAAHRVAIVHRDLKPHNVLIFHDGTARLSDFWSE